MKTWQIFAIGMLAVVAGFSLPLYESLLAGVSAVIIVGAVALGFLLRPKKDVFLVRTTFKARKPDQFLVGHDQIAVKVVLTRLWLLFLPTVIAVGFLVATAVQGTTWNFSLFGQDRFGEGFPAGFYVFRGLLFFVVGTISAWISERWVLRDAEARSLRSLTVRGKRVSYAFVDSSGGYYGGEGLIVGKLRSGEPINLAFYRPTKPEVNKTPLTSLFHRFVVIGHGLPDLVGATTQEAKTLPVRVPS